MDGNHRIGLGVGAAVIALGAAVGAGYAVSGAYSQARAQAQSPEGTDRSGTGQSRGGGLPGMSNLAPALAENLGVEESEVSAAIQSVTPANRPSGRPIQGAQPSNGSQPSPRARPSQGGRPGTAKLDAALATAIAEKLGLEESKVAAALAEVRAEQQADRPDGSGSPSPKPSASATA